ncbi:hypothetical protein AB2L27_02865 [Kineococcus sp. LSe6-4]|uniref:Uncharacterized protein n=1 Tax=Kineococcus halophytocola TaxID=3234027 RepID=A0ABV4GWP0_9ACTN
MTDQDPLTSPSTSPTRTPGSWLGWVAAVVGIGAVAVLVYVATLLVGSARDARAIDEASKNLPAVGTYELAGTVPAEQLTQAPSEQWSLTATQAEVGREEVRVHLTWTNVSKQTATWACPGPVDLTRWQSTSVRLSGAGSGASSAHCTRDEPTAQEVAPGGSVQDWEAFPRDSAFGAGPARITAQVDRPSEESDGLGGTVDDTPDVAFTLDLAKAAFTAG